MEAGRIIQGRAVRAQDIAFIRALIATHPTWHRTRLSQELCQRWGWVAANGRLKDMAARALLRKLHAQGLIALPAPVRSANNAFRHRSPAPVTIARAPIEGPLAALAPLAFSPVDGARESQLFAGLLQRYHYLGYSGPVGENLKYLVTDRRARPVACLLFGAPAWRMACRERFIGWDGAARAQGLALLANNMRFLILPWVTSRNLASRILSAVAKRLPLDWQKIYGYEPVLLETFVDQDRFRGTCYRAANWVHVGDTQGRGKLDRQHRHGLPVKAVFLYPLRRDFCRRLCSPSAPH